VDPDHRGAILHGQIHDLADLLGMGLAERAAENGEILRKHIDQPSVDRAPAGDHAIAGDDGFTHAEIGGTMGDEHVVFFETARIEQHVEPLAGGELALAMLDVDPPLAPAQPCLLAPRFEGGNDVLHAASGIWEPGQSSAASTMAQDSKERACYNNTSENL